SPHSLPSTNDDISQRDRREMDDEVIATDKGQQVRIERAGNTSNEPAAYERRYLVTRDRNADRTGDHFVFLDCAQDPRDPRPLDKQEGNEHSKNDQPHDHGILAGGDGVIVQIADMTKAGRAIRTEPL